MLKKKVLNKKAIIGIFGLGYIGLPRSIQFAKKGFKVIGFDIDKKKIELTKKAKVCYCDPYVKEISGLRNYNFKMNSVKINYKHLKNFDAILIVTDHDRFNYDTIRKNSKIIVDTRGVYKKEYKNIISA